MPEDLRAETFQPHVGTTFTVAGRGDDVDMPEAVGHVLELVSVDLDEPMGGPRAQPFRLIFQGPPEQTLPQAIYTLDHDGLGTLDIFFVPIAPGRYEAIFN